LVSGAADGKVATLGRDRQVTFLYAGSALVCAFSSPARFTTSRVIYVLVGTNGTLAVSQRSDVAAAYNSGCQSDLQENLPAVGFLLASFVTVSSFVLLL
jgi:hypothetical protein